ncbi:hypothetical protein ACFX1X_003695 [Malus domestica]
MEHENDPSSKMRSRLENGLPNKAVIKSNHEPSFLVGSVFKIEHYWVVPNGPGSLGPVAVLIYHNKYNTIFVTKIQKYKPINADRFVLGLLGISQSIHRLLFFLLIGEERQPNPSRTSSFSGFRIPGPPNLWFSDSFPRGSSRVRYPERGAVD